MFWVPSFSSFLRFQPPKKKEKEKRGGRSFGDYLPIYGRRCVFYSLSRFRAKTKISPGGVSENRQVKQVLTSCSGSIGRENMEFTNMATHAIDRYNY